MYKNGFGYMTSIATVSIYGKAFYIFCKHRSQIILNLGMEHRGYKAYKICINNDP